MTEQLKALAEAAQGWEWLCDDPGCGCREAMEAFQKEATPERILALIAENERLQRIADDFQNRWNSERQINESQISGGRYPDGTPAW